MFAHKNKMSGDWMTEQAPVRTHFAQPPPDEVVFDGKKYTLWTYSQLKVQSIANLKSRATLMRDNIGQHRLPALNCSGGHDPIIRWILEVEVAIANAATGSSFTFLDFGVPDDFPVQAPQIGSGPTAKSMYWQQHGSTTPYASGYTEGQAEWAPCNKPKPREPMSSVDNSVTADLYNASKAAMLASRHKQTSSNIF